MKRTGSKGLGGGSSAKRALGATALLTGIGVLLLSGSPVAAEAAAKGPVLSPHPGQEVLPARPVPIRVRAGGRADLTARLNGRPIHKHFKSSARRGVRTLQASPSHGLRHRRNVLRVEVDRPGQGGKRRGTVRFRVAGDRPLAAAGVERTAALHSRLRFDGGKSRRPSRTRPRDPGRLSYRWTLLRAPRTSALSDRVRGRPRTATGTGDVVNLGPDPTFSAKRSPAPRFRPDSPGTYEVELKVTDRSGKSGKDVIDLSVVPEPAVRIDTMAPPAEDFPTHGIRVGTQFFPAHDPGGRWGPGELDPRTFWLQLVALDRKTLQPVDGPKLKDLANKTYGLGQDSVMTDLQRLGNEHLVIVSAQTGIQDCSPDDCRSVGDWWFDLSGGDGGQAWGMGVPKWEFREWPQFQYLGNFSAIGVPGSKLGSATWHGQDDAACRRDQGEFCTPGAIRGLLVADNTGHYDFASTEFPSFDTQAPGSDANTSVMRIGDSTHTEHFPVGARGGFHVVFVDRLTLDVQSHWFNTHRAPNSGAPCCAVEMRKMTNAIRSATQPSPDHWLGSLVFISSRGDPTIDPADPEGSGAARDLVDVLTYVLGGTRIRAYSALDPALSPNKDNWSYSLAAAGGTGAGHGIEADGPQSNGLNGVPLAGYMKRENDYGFDLGASLVGEEFGGAGVKLRDVVFSQPSSWPEQGNDGRTKAIAWAAAQITMDSSRSKYWKESYDKATWDSRVTKINGLEYSDVPASERSGLSEDDLAWAKQELQDEIAWLGAAHGYVSKLAEPFTKNAFVQWAVFKEIADDINKLVDAPAINTAGVKAHLVVDAARESLEALPEVGDGIALFNTIYDTGMEWAKVDAEGNTEAEEPFEVTVDKLGVTLTNRLKTVQDTLTNQMLDVVVSDYEKLRTVGLCGPTLVDCPDPPADDWEVEKKDQDAIAAAAETGSRYLIYTALIPQKFQAWAPPQSPWRKTLYFGHQPAGRNASVWFCPFHNQPESAQVLFPAYRDLGSTGSDKDLWQVLAYAQRTGSGAAGGDGYSMNIPQSTIFSGTPESLFGAASPGLAEKEAFWWRAYNGATSAFTGSFPYDASPPVKWITGQNDEFGIGYDQSCGY